MRTYAHMLCDMESSWNLLAGRTFLERSGGNPNFKAGNPTSTCILQISEISRGTFRNSPNGLPRLGPSDPRNSELRSLGEPHIIILKRLRTEKEPPYAYVTRTSAASDTARTRPQKFLAGKCILLEISQKFLGGKAPSYTTSKAISTCFIFALVAESVSGCSKASI